MRKYLAGFTFIELLIVVMIISAFSGLSLAYYNNFNKASKLDTEANKLLQTLELAKKKATARDIEGYESHCGYASDPENIFNGYKVEITTNGYSIKIECTTSTGTYENTVYSYSFLNTAKVITNTTTSILFTPAAGQVTLTEDLVANPIRFKHSTGTTDKCPGIEISSTGIIQKSSTNTCF